MNLPQFRHRFPFSFLLFQIYSAISAARLKLSGESLIQLFMDYSDMNMIRNSEPLSVKVIL